MFQTVFVPFDAFRELPGPSHRWLMTCLLRYANREGRCWPSMRQLAADARMSLATVCRRLAEMARLGCFTRGRKGVGRYTYQLADAYRPGRVSGVERLVSPRDTQQANLKKHKAIEVALKKDAQHDDAPWENRLRAWQETRFWLAWWGPKPSEPGCWCPVSAGPAPCPPRGRAPASVFQGPA